jgi:hypothetical protein
MEPLRFEDLAEDEMRGGVHRVFLDVVLQQLAALVSFAVLDECDREIEEQSGIVRRIRQSSAIGSDGLVGFAQLIEAVAEHAQDLHCVGRLDPGQRLQRRAAIRVVPFRGIGKPELIRGQGIARIVGHELLQRGDGLVGLPLIDEHRGVVNGLGTRLIGDQGEGGEKECEGEGCAQHVGSLERRGSRSGFRPQVFGDQEHQS